METGKNLTLAIETAIDGGSLSLLEGNTEIDHWIGESEVSKSEDILWGLSRLLKRSNLKTERIGLVVVSKDAGSFTGLKIGLATAKGLTKALHCRLLEVSLWDVLIEFIVSNSLKSEMVFLPSGKEGIVCRKFEAGKFLPEIKIISRSQFETDLESYNTVNSLTHRRIIQNNKSDEPNENHSMFDLGTNLASYVGKHASDNEILTDGI